MRKNKSKKKEKEKKRRNIEYSKKAKKNGIIEGISVGIRTSHLNLIIVY